MEREGVDFRVDVLKRESASTVILAPHGGGIEPGLCDPVHLTVKPVFEP